MGKRKRQVCYVNTSTNIWSRKWYPDPAGSWWEVWNGELCLRKIRFQKDEGGQKLFKEISFFLLVCGFSGTALSSFPFRSCCIAQRVAELVCRCHVTKTLQSAEQDPSWDCRVGFSPSHTNTHMVNACPWAISSSHEKTRETDISNVVFSFQEWDISVWLEKSFPKIMHVFPSGVRQGWTGELQTWTLTVKAWNIRRDESWFCP